MHKILKRLLLGLLVWAVPFFSSFFVWDLEANAPAISMAWFNAFMAFTWALGFAVAAYLYFRSVNKNTVKEGFLTGITWYIVMLAMDMIFLVILFGMSITDFFPILLTYQNTVIMCVMIGYVKK